MRFLINNGADPMHLSPNPDEDPTALSLFSGGVLLAAARGGHEDVVMALLRTGLFKCRWVLLHGIDHHELVRDAVTFLIDTGDAALVQ